MSSENMAKKIRRIWQGSEQTFTFSKKSLRNFSGQPSGPASAFYAHGLSHSCPGQEDTQVPSIRGARMRGCGGKKCRMQARRYLGTTPSWALRMKRSMK